MKRHFGRLKNSDQRCLVVFMRLPDKPDHALVVTSDNLPSRFEHVLMDIADSNEGQAEATLANVLSRRLSDNGQSVLQALHEARLLQAVPIDNVIMYPQPSMPFPLRQILDNMDALEAGAQPPPPEKFHPHANNYNANKIEDKAGMARNLIIEAELLERTAREKRATALRYAPEMVSKMKAAEDRAAFHEYESPPAPVMMTETKIVKAKTKPSAKAKAKGKAKTAELIQVPTTMKKVTRRSPAQ
jgi:hypothetical protein